MHRHMLKSKIHRATVTACDPDYVGSVTIDAELMRQADLLPNEQVHLWDIENGARLVTYAYGSYGEQDLDAYSPIVVHVADNNRVVGVDSNPEVLLAGFGDRWFDEVPGSLGAGGESLSAGSLQ